MPEPSAHTKANFKRRYGCDFRTYANLLFLQANACAMCNQPHRPRHPLVADPRLVDGQATRLVCKPCRHALRVFLSDPEKVSKYMGFQISIEDQLAAGGTPYATRKYYGQNPSAQAPKPVEIKEKVYKINYENPPVAEVTCPSQVVDIQKENIS